MNTDNNWQKEVPEIFWREMSPCEHVVQVYDNDAILMESLIGFVSGGLKKGDCVILIAGKTHMESVEKILEARNFCLKSVRETNQFIELDVEETLARFMINGWPDEQLFKKLLLELLDVANGRTIRAFGEMVAFLWEKGHNAATVRLEQLWTLFCNSGGLCLFCAYPKSGFRFDNSKGIQTICMEHSKVIRNSPDPDEILFQKVEKVSY